MDNALGIMAAFPSARDKLRAQTPAPSPATLPGAAGRAGSPSDGVWGCSVVEPLGQHKSRTPVTPKGQTLRKRSHAGGKHNTHLYFLFLYFGGLAVAEFSSTCFQDKKAHGAMCPKREGSSPPWTPPPVFFRAGEGTLYMQVVSSTPLCNCPCHPRPPNGFVLTCARGI